MKLLTIDQSMASCALIVMDGEEPVYKEVLHTTGSDKAKDWQLRFDNPVEQMKHITTVIVGVAKSFNVDNVVLESLSFGSAGNATRDLAGLFFCIQLELLNAGFSISQIHTVAPTSVKAWARGKLPGEMQEVMNPAGTKMIKIKMGKDEMMDVCNRLCPGLLTGYTKTGKNGGATDLADAYLIGRCYIERSGNK
jgi:hypothetical protein